MLYPPMSDGAAAGAANPSLTLWVVGGTPDHPGGLEAYCDRAVLALQRHGKGLAVRQLAANTAYMKPQDALRMAQALARMVRERRSIDLVWIQVSNLPDLVYLAGAKLLGLRTLVTPHFGANSRMQTVSWRRALSRSMLGLADRVGLLFATQNREITLPKGVPASTVSTFLPDFSGPDMQLSDGAEGSSVRLIHAGRFSAEKGSFQVLEVCACLLERKIPFKAHLVGRSDEVTMARMHEMMAASGLENHVELVDWLSEDEMQQALGRADVLVHLSSIDSFPLIVLEALARGTLPVIKNMAGAMHMVSLLGGHVVSSETAVADACEWIANLDRAGLHRQQVLARCRTQDEFGWPTIVSRLEAIFQKTLRR